MDIGDVNDFDSRGSAASDTLVGANITGNPTIYGGGGNDSISAGIVSTTIYAGSGNDVVNGNVGADKLYGGSGSDTIDGGGGNDLLVGGIGADMLTGGIGQDTFVFRTTTDSLASSFDTVMDVDAATDLFAIGHGLSGLTNGLNIVGTGNLALDLLQVNGALAQDASGNFVTALSANGAAVVNVVGGDDAGTYLLINDATTVFDSAHDAVVKLAAQQVLTSSNFVV
jgi:Ca2+-binding RTX toxin-like protein